MSIFKLLKKCHRFWVTFYRSAATAIKTITLVWTSCLLISEPTFDLRISRAVKRAIWKSMTCAWLRSPKAMPPDIRTVAVSGTLKTFHPKFSKNVASVDCPVVFPPQGPPVKTNLYTRLSGRPPFINVSAFGWLCWSGMVGCNTFIFGVSWLLMKRLWGDEIYVDGIRYSCEGLIWGCG